MQKPKSILTNNDHVGQDYIAKNSDSAYTPPGGGTGTGPIMSGSTTRTTTIYTSFRSGLDGSQPRTGEQQRLLQQDAQDRERQARALPEAGMAAERARLHPPPIPGNPTFVGQESALHVTSTNPGKRLDQVVLESSLAELSLPSDKIGDSLDTETAEDEDLSSRISKYLSTEYQGEKNAEEQLLKVDSGDEPYISSRHPSNEQSRVVARNDYPGCNLRGAHPLPGSTKYKSIIFYEGSRYSLGKYDFVSDAALAYDKAALSIGPYWDINFSSWNEYIATRTLEVMRKGSDQVDLTSVLEEISSRASEVVSRVVDEAELNDFEWVSFVICMCISYAHFLTRLTYSVTVLIYRRMNKV